MYIHIHSFSIHSPYRLSESVEYTSQRYTEGSCFSSVLCIVVCICQSPPSIFTPPPNQGNHKFGFEIWVCFCIWYSLVSYLESNKMLVFNCGVIKLSWIITRKIRKSCISFSLKIMFWPPKELWFDFVCFLNRLFCFLLAHIIFGWKSLFLVFILTFFCVCSVYFPYVFQVSKLGKKELSLLAHKCG